MKSYGAPVILLGIAFVLSLPMVISAQRDFLTPEEVEIVREAQAIDSRVDVLIQAIDRRFAVIGLEVDAAKVKKKGDWGDLPKGTRAELFYDIRRLLQKAVDDIDNLAERPDSAVEDPTRKKKDQAFQVLFPKAVKNLAAAAQRYVPVLQGQLDSAGSNSEKGSIIASIELCRQIIDSVAKLPEIEKKAWKKS